MKVECLFWYLFVCQAFIFFKLKRSPKHQCLFVFFYQYHLFQVHFYSTSTTSFFWKKCKYLSLRYSTLQLHVCCVTKTLCLIERRNETTYVVHTQSFLSLWNLDLKKPWRYFSSFQTKTKTIASFYKTVLLLSTSSYFIILWFWKILQENNVTNSNVILALFCLWDYRFPSIFTWVTYLKKS